MFLIVFNLILLEEKFDFVCDLTLYFWPPHLLYKSIIPLSIKYICYITFICILHIIVIIVLCTICLLVKWIRSSWFKDLVITYCICCIERMIAWKRRSILIKLLFVDSMKTIPYKLPDTFHRACTLIFFWF